MTDDTQCTVFREVSGSKYFTNDIKLAAALVTNKHQIVEIKSKTNPRNGKKELLFGFSQTVDCKEDALMFLSGSLHVDASTVMDNRDKLLSYVTNNSKNVIEELNGVR